MTKPTIRCLFSFVIFIQTVSTAFLCFTPLMALAARPAVVIYTAVDQFISEPVLKDFENQTGIRVKAVYDVEATKTTGLVNRLLAERRHPKCDVFWNNEVLKSILLKQKEVITPYRSPNAMEIPKSFKDPDGYWTGFGARARVLVVNTQSIQPNTYPTSIMDLTQNRFNGKIAMANPLFGTTATHVAALFSVLGEEKARDYFLDLKANGLRILDGNSVVKDQVGQGSVLAGLTDTDDVNIGIRSGLPIHAIYPDGSGLGTLLIPNTVCLVAGSPNQEAGKKMVDYLLSKTVERKLAFGSSVQMPLRKDVPVPKGFVTIDQIGHLDVDYEEVARMMHSSMIFIQDVFLR